MTDKDKCYLGDGAYVEMRHGEFVVTTSDGLTDTNTIFLERDALTKLFCYAKDHGWHAPRSVEVTL